jgi:hypothetical protein
MAVNGSLDEMSLYTLLQILRDGERSGVLSLSRAEERGMVYVANGLVLDVVLIRTREQTVVAMGREALKKLLTWNDASFCFDQVLCLHTLALPEPEKPGYRSERPLPGAVIPLQSEEITLSTRLDLVPHPPLHACSSVELDMVQWRILSHISPAQSLQMICTTTGIDTETMLQHVRILLSVGMVRIVSTPPRQVSTLLESSYMHALSA